MSLKEDTLVYHSKGRKGKIETGLTKSCKNQNDITLAYSPRVAEPCKEIARDLICPTISRHIAVMCPSNLSQISTAMKTTFYGFKGMPPIQIFISSQSCPKSINIHIKHTKDGGAKELDI